jgi:26S proteasome regulatory subunit N4
MILAANHQRRQNFYQPAYSDPINIPRNLPSLRQQQPSWSAAPAIPSPPPSDYSDITASNHIYSFGTDQTLFDYQPQRYSSPSQSLMQSEHHNSWLSTGQLTPTSATRARHYREPSLSSLGSAGPASPYTANTSNPQVAGELYHDFNDYHPPSSKPLTPAHTPSQEQYLTPTYPSFYSANHIPFAMTTDGLPSKMGNAELMPASDFSGSSARPSSAVASHDSPSASTPPGYDAQERRKHGEASTVESWLNEYLQLGDNAAYRSMPKLDRTMTDIYADELYNPSFQITSAPSTANASIPATVPPSNDVFAQRLQAANSQHLSASQTQVPMTIPSRERSPFRQGSPLAPSGNNFGQQSPNFKFGTAAHMREQQKAENDARALREQMERVSPGQSTPKTISPKDVDLVYHETDEDASMPLFPPPQQQRSPAQYRQHTSLPREATDVDETASQHSFGSMATSRRESSSAYSATSQATPQQSTFNFVSPSVPGSVRQIPQQYPFVPQSRRQPSSLSNVTEDFPASLTSMESGSSDYVPDASDNKKPSGAAADTGTYTCTYHGCTLRFETPAKLQRHKREGHRHSASVIVGGGEGGMTSAALRNTQNGPHKVSTQSHSSSS